MYDCKRYHIFFINHCSVSIEKYEQIRRSVRGFLRVYVWSVGERPSGSSDQNVVVPVQRCGKSYNE